MSITAAELAGAGCLQAGQRVWRDSSIDLLPAAEQVIVCNWMQQLFWGIAQSSAGTRLCPVPHAFQHVQSCLTLGSEQQVCAFKLVGPVCPPHPMQALQRACWLYIRLWRNSISLQKMSKPCCQRGSAESSSEVTTDLAAMDAERLQIMQTACAHMGVARYRTATKQQQCHHRGI